MIKGILITFFLLLLSGMSRAQITLEMAIQIALENNYSIQAVEHRTAINTNLATKGQAGLLPTLGATVVADYGIDNTRVELVGQSNPIIVNGAQSLLINAEIAANYTIYAGGANRLVYDQSLLNTTLVDAQGKLEVENVIMAVVSAYYNVLRAENNYQALEGTIDLSLSRLKLAQTNKQLSGGSKSNVLQAQVDLNQDSINLYNAKQALLEAEISLNQALSRPLTTEVKVVDESAPIFEDYETLKSAAMEQNWQIKAAKLNTQSSLLDYKISRSAYLPQLNLKAAYGYTRSEAEGGFISLNQNNGLGLGLTLSVPIYQAGKRKISVTNAQLQANIRTLEEKDLAFNLEAELLKAYNDYTMASELVLRERKNLAISEENFNLLKTRYELGLETSTDFRQAQVNVLLTQSNLNNVEFNVHLTAMELMRLSGRLISSK